MSIDGRSRPTTAATASREPSMYIVDGDDDDDDGGDVRPPSGNFDRVAERAFAQLQQKDATIQELSRTVELLLDERDALQARLERHAVGKHSLLSQFETLAIDVETQDATVRELQRRLDDALRALEASARQKKNADDDWGRRLQRCDDERRAVMEERDALRRDVARLSDVESSLGVKCHGAAEEAERLYTLAEETARSSHTIAERLTARVRELEVALAESTASCHDVRGQLASMQRQRDSALDAEQREGERVAQLQERLSTMAAQFREEAEAWQAGSAAHEKVEGMASSYVDRLRDLEEELDIEIQHRKVGEERLAMCLEECARLRKSVDEAQMEKKEAIELLASSRNELEAAKAESRATRKMLDELETKYCRALRLATEADIRAEDRCRQAALEASAAQREVLVARSARDDALKSLQKREDSASQFEQVYQTLQEKSSTIETLQRRLESETAARREAEVALRKTQQTQVVHVQNAQQLSSDLQQRHETELRDMVARLATTTAVVSQQAARTAQVEERLAATESRLLDANTALSNLRQELHMCQEDARRLSIERDGLNAEVGALTSQLHHSTEEVHAIQEKLEKRNTQRSEALTRATCAESAAKAAREEASSMKALAEKFVEQQPRIESLEEELRKLRTSHGARTEGLRSALGERRELSLQCKNLREQLQEQESNLSAMRSKEAALRSDLGRTQSALSRSTSTIRNAEERMDYAAAEVSHCLRRVVEIFDTQPTSGRTQKHQTFDHSHMLPQEVTDNPSLREECERISQQCFGQSFSQVLSRSLDQESAPQGPPPPPTRLSMTVTWREFRKRLHAALSGLVLMDDTASAQHEVALALESIVEVLGKNRVAMARTKQ